ncbi:ATP-dependent helicase [Dialister succinatiphilus]|uniref:DNA 3'-5' helicase n=1 Tax=Dialister succinatiphilus YIT 11850 TaxID=742743 RepID=H1D2R5_9FIRM|nr:ATP-dependent DNA helicase [Dialister succinatiphilus]EHO62185.1 hypothetical protein HMPREF9453_01903 [Dialister succinatiphilus YIT 11850]
MSQQGPNKEQLEAINATEGPVLIIAGPGTGKTYTLIERTMHLIRDKHVRPENIMVCTFTNKAAKELITRLTNQLTKDNININLDEMYIGTFHSICLRILKEYAEDSDLEKNYLLDDEFIQSYMVYCRLWDKFREIEGFPKLFPKYLNIWRKPICTCQKICGYVNELNEELVDSDKLEEWAEGKTASGAGRKGEHIPASRNTDPAIILSEIMRQYNSVLKTRNMIDFSSILTETYRLLQGNRSILSKIQEKIQYIMVDEYQDTNYIQERLISLLAGARQNVCVVGDDDQAMYRFRGATIENILTFPELFLPRPCKQIKLVTNYRSNDQIVDFYNYWMNDYPQANGIKAFAWSMENKNFRYPKKIVPGRGVKTKSPAVVSIIKNDKDSWERNVTEFILDLKESGKISDYNQVAILSSSIKRRECVDLQQYMASQGLKVYAPRAGELFNKVEVQWVIGCLLIMFPQLKLVFQQYERANFYLDMKKYYTECILNLKNCIFNDSQKRGKNLDYWVHDVRKKIGAAKGKLHLTFSGLVYEMFAFWPFNEMLAVNMADPDSHLLRQSRNLSQLVKIIESGEFIHGIRSLDAGKLEWNLSQMFARFLRSHLEMKDNEYEDEVETVPEGYVPFLTIHQSKGLEFPIVIVLSLWDFPLDQVDIANYYVKEYTGRNKWEPYESIKYFDFWRKYYTAFSRAQDLLILSCWRRGEIKRESPSPIFASLLETVPSVEDTSFDINEFHFEKVKKSILKDTYSFTTDVSLYDSCPMRYKFNREMHFSSLSSGGMIFGQMVHETIEDIHRAAMRKDYASINEGKIQSWMQANYSTLAKREGIHFSESILNQARIQIMRYVHEVEKSIGWGAIKQAEYAIEMVRNDYIIKGKIDLISAGDGKSVDGRAFIDLVDFKTGRKLKEESPMLRRYEKQLQVYAYLIEQKTSYTVKNMRLYFMGENDSTPWLSFPARSLSSTEVEKTMESFDHTVHQIMRNDFEHRAPLSAHGKIPEFCKYCEFRYFCGRNGMGPDEELCKHETR